QAILESNEMLTQKVIKEEAAINELQLEIDERVMQLLALHQLMAVDLRFVLAATRINADLERIGDQAVNIAQAAQRILRHARVKPYIDLPRMTELAEGMVRDSLDSLVRKDVERAKAALSPEHHADPWRATRSRATCPHRAD